MVTVSRLATDHLEEPRVLEIRDLRRSYGQVRALDGVTFAVEPGSIVGFVGRNGAGKTTTMRVVMGVVRPDQGEVRWHGQPIDQQLRLRFGYLPEERGLYPKMRVRDQLVYLARMSGCSRAEARRSADEWIARLGVQDRADSAVEELSLGNQQRVQLAAALVHRPDLLVLDEPFSGLDPVGVDVLGGVLRDEADRGVAIVFSSHQLDLVERMCDRVVIIEAGRIASEVGDEPSDEPLVRLSVEVAAADPAWTDHVVGATVLERAGDRVLVEVANGDAQRVLDAARAAGEVRSFQVGTRSLAERFREAVER